MRVENFILIFCAAQQSLFVENLFIIFGLYGDRQRIPLKNASQ